MPDAVNVLLVEDDDVDAEAVRRGLGKLKLRTQLTRLKQADHALLELANLTTLARPCLVLLDLSLPGMNGLEFLTRVRSSDDLKRTVVFVLTTSDDPGDKIAAYDRHVAGYVVKSRVGSDYRALAEMLDRYTEIVDLPGSRSR